MNTRSRFLKWIITLDHPMISKINQSNYLSFNERNYVFEVLHKLSHIATDIQPMIDDYYHLERQRYIIVDAHIISEKVATSRIANAIRFCAKSREQKRECLFKVNLSISDYLAKSTYLWDDCLPSPPQQTQTQYLFIPSFLRLAPKEICLINLNALLLDIMNYEEVFSYWEFFGLVKKVIDLEDDRLDTILLEYMDNQILYFQTILPEV